MLERTDGDLIDLINERQSMTLVEKTEFVNSIHIGNFDNLSIINQHPSIIVIIQLIHPSFPRPTVECVASSTSSSEFATESVLRT